MKPYTTVIEHIRRLASENPDRTAADTYFEDGQPVCIFGHVLALLGAHQDDIRVVAPSGSVVAKGYEIASTLRWDELDIYCPNERETQWSNAVQNNQDQGYTWGQALEWADQHYGVTA